MMRLSDTIHAVAANKVALEADRAKDAVEREVQALEREMKRLRTEASSTKNAEGERYVGPGAPPVGGNACSEPRQH